MKCLKYKGYYIKKSDLTNEQLVKIKKDLKVKPKLLEFGKAEANDVSFKLYKFTKKYVIVPKYYGISMFGETKFKVDPINYDIEFNGELRDYQIPIVDKLLNHLNDKGGGLLSVPCGRGKTSMAIYIAHKLGIKTLVIVHKKFLGNQWKKQIKRFCNIDAGTIAGKVIDVKDKAIVVGMIQSISMKEYDDEVLNQFGLVIYDESHHCASKVFSQALMKTCCKYTLALSATPDRTDGLTRVMHWFLGDTIYREKIRINNQVIAKVFNYTSSDEKFKEKKYAYGPQKGKPDIIKMMGRLVELKQRTNHIVNIINEIRKDQDRKIIVLSKYVNHLKEMKECIDLKIQQDVIDGKLQEDEIKTTLYIGAMKQWQREEAEDEADIFFATNDLAREGLDIERLNTVLLATSQKDVNQSVGRAMRKLLENGDLRPLILDFADMLSSFKNHSRIRKTFYKQCKYVIEEYDIDDDFIKKEDNIIKLEDTIKTQPVEFIIDKPKDDKAKDAKLNKDNNSDDNTHEETDKEIDDTPKKKPKKIDNNINLKKRLI
jgi:superfamily II DNA or RNA helicase